MGSSPFGFRVLGGFGNLSARKDPKVESNAARQSVDGLPHVVPVEVAADADRDRRVGCA